MGQRQCEKCSEIVDEAKAFCPGCGNAFVEEEKREASQFDKLDPTIQFGQTMYNQMLEDMGLNIGAVPAPVQKRIETIEPVIDRAAPTPKAPTIITVEAAVADPKEPQKKLQTSASSLKWYILIGIAAVILLPIAIVSAVILVLAILARLQ